MAGGFRGCGTPTKLFEGHFSTSTPARVYDISRDDQRFLMIKEPASPDRPPASITVVLHWLEELKQHVPAR